MDRRVRSDHCDDRPAHAYEAGGADAVPASIILEMSEYLVWTGPVAHSQEDDEECNESQDIEREDSSFDARQPPCEKDVEEYGERTEHYGKEDKVPCLGDI